MNGGGVPKLKNFHHGGQTRGELTTWPPRGALTTWPTRGALTTWPKRGALTTWPPRGFKDWKFCHIAKCTQREGFARGPRKVLQLHVAFSQFSRFYRIRVQTFVGIQIRTY